MTLGILLTTTRNLCHVLGITEAALGKGHEVEIFSMDEGVRLLENESFRALAQKNGVNVSFCEYSTKRLGVPTSDIPLENITAGSQFNNAMMARKAHKVLSL